MIGARDIYEEGALVFPCVRIQREYADVEDIVASAAGASASRSSGMATI